MSIKFKINIIDVANILVTKGASFISTLFIFSLISNRLSSESFANFGYWWSVGVMLGGVSLGGLASALIREVSEHKSLSKVRNIIFRFFFVLSSLVLFLFIAMKNISIDSSYYLLFISFLFGISLQLQISVLSLLRAIKASESNLIASLILATFVPLCFYLISQKDIDVGSLLVNVVIAYSFCLVFILFSARKILTELLKNKPVNVRNNKIFYSNIGSFALLTIYVSVILIVDASIFRYSTDPSDFNIVATSKIYFERFILPLLLVFSGALSIMVLRYDGDHPATLELNLSLKKITLLVLIITSVVFGYYLYLYAYSKDSVPLSIPIVILVTIGYLLYVLNGVLLDVLVIRKKKPTVLYSVALFLIIYIIGQFIMISKFGIIGWSIFWFIFHLFVSIVLISSGCGTIKQHNFS